MAAVLTASQRATFEFAKGLGLSTPDGSQIEAALQDLRSVQGAALIIGGIAVVHHGYERYTKDIDILYGQTDGAILKRLRPHFKIVTKSRSGWHHLQHKKTGVRLELIPEGGLTTYGFIPGPEAVGGEAGFISLFGLVWLKLVAGRAQDDADIVVLAKSRLPEMRRIRTRLREDVRGRFGELLARARREQDSDRSRP